MWLETARLRAELEALKATLQAKPQNSWLPPPSSPPHAAMGPQPVVLSPPTPHHAPEGLMEHAQCRPLVTRAASEGAATRSIARPPSATALSLTVAGDVRSRPGSPSLADQLQEGFNHAMSAVTVFEVPHFLDNDDVVVESHIFTDQGGFAWRLWVKPHDKQDSIGLYLVPAEDLDEPYTADFELAIVGARGKVWRRELRGGRATLQKRSAGHGWPTFVSRDELSKSHENGRDAMLHNGTLVVTASRISNVRPKAELAAGGGRDLSRTI